MAVASWARHAAAVARSALGRRLGRRHSFHLILPTPCQLLCPPTNRLP